MDIQQKAAELLREAVKSIPGCGMQFCVFKEGKCAVHVCEGYAEFDGSRKVDERTLFPIYSTSKAVPAAALTRLIEEGRVFPEQPVTDIWPEFGRNGKETTLIRHLLSHTSGLPQRLPEQTGYAEICDWDKMIRAVENASCDWTPGTKTRYQSLTYGWVTAEVIQRITKMSFKEYITSTLGFSDDGDFVFGLNDETEKLTSDFKLRDGIEKSKSFSKCDPLDDLMKNPLVRRTVQPGYNGFASAYGLAAYMSDVVNCKFFNRKSLLDATDCSHRPEKGTPVKNNTMFGYGFSLSGPADDPGLCFGHGGYGGTEAVANRDTAVSCGFTTNILGFESIKAELYALAGIEQRSGWLANTAV